MQNTEVLEIDKQISAVFKSPAAAEKYNQLVAEKDRLIQKQSSGEYDRFQRQLEALQAAQTASGNRYNDLSILAAEKAEIVREIQLKLETANGDLNATNFELALVSNQISQNRAAIKTAERRLKEYGGTNESIG